ncbi:hypothetical protein SAMN05216359_1279 [Roseateles sp. YR242]|uniref:hypothetical protein n=1 Tax=Roseateles sp. YR242 TaxID=1855305 RepID=UPI0008BBFDD7|nr:hypothetical protein [Roseateles sp. YR242]SEL92877.1 hypothetical protein SAMN05216359_1279 [Roseateles sp. YR242]
MTIDTSLIPANLLAILDEVRQQPDVGTGFPPELLTFSGHVERLREWIEDANEFGIAYELLVSMLENFPFQLSGPTAVKLLEVGLVMQFKTDRPQDVRFDFR